MKDVNTYREIMQVLLGDQNGRRYTESMLDMGLSQALRTLKSFQPWTERVRAVIREYVSGWAILGAAPDPETEILSVWQEGTGSRLDCEDLILDGKRCLRFCGESLLPAVGERLILEVGCPWTIRGLDDARITNVPEDLAQTVAAGAAGYAALIRARSVTEVFGKRPEDTQQLIRQGEALIASFTDALREDSSRKEFHRSPWPARGFRI